MKKQFEIQNVRQFYQFKFYRTYFHLNKSFRITKNRYYDNVDFLEIKFNDRSKYSICQADRIRANPDWGNSVGTFRLWQATYQK